MEINKIKVSELPVETSLEGVWLHGYKEKGNSKTSVRVPSNVIKGSQLLVEDVKYNLNERSELKLDWSVKNDKLYHVELFGTNASGFTINTNGLKVDSTYNDTTLLVTNSTTVDRVVAVVGEGMKNAVSKFNLLPNETAEIIIKAYGDWCSMTAIPLGGWDMEVVETSLPPYFRNASFNYWGMVSDFINVGVGDPSEIVVDFYLSDWSDFEDNTLSMRYVDGGMYVFENQPLVTPLNTGVYFAEIEGARPHMDSLFVLEAKSVSGEIITSDIFGIKWL